MATDLRVLVSELTPVGGPCTPARFFEPTRAFFDAMQAFRGLDIFDIGAGQGHVTEALVAEGHHAIGLDIRADGARSVIEANAADFPYPAGAIGLFCRPCHGAYFVEPAIEQLIDRDAAAILYVGFAKNLSDLGRHRQRFRRAAVKVGADRESLWIWMRRERS